MTSLAVLGLGGNMGNPVRTIAQAIEKIHEQIGEIDLISSNYESSAWGVLDQPNFVNAVIGVKTTLDPIQLLHTCLKIEKELGRVRKIGERWTERIIDIDLLVVEDRIIDSQDLTLPHPEITSRNFVLVPFAEIYPDFIHPCVKKSINELLKHSLDDGIVKKL